MIDSIDGESLIEQYVMIRVSTGDEIIGKLPGGVDADSEVIVIEDPMRVIVNVSSSGYPMIGMLRYAIFSKDQRVVINRGHVVSTTVPSMGMIDYYEAMLEYHYARVDGGVDQTIGQASDQARDIARSAKTSDGKTMSVESISRFFTELKPSSNNQVN